MSTIGVSDEWSQVSRRLRTQLEEFDRWVKDLPIPLHTEFTEYRSLAFPFNLGCSWLDSDGEERLVAFVAVTTRGPVAEAQLDLSTGPGRILVGQAPIAIQKPNAPSPLEARAIEDSLRELLESGIAEPKVVEAILYPEEAS